MYVMYTHYINIGLYALLYMYVNLYVYFNACLHNF